MDDSSKFIGLGANLGDRQSTLTQAIQGLRRLGSLAAISSLYETEPVKVEGPVFLNIVIELKTESDAVQLQTQLRQLEARLGRAGMVGNAARPIDIDLLVMAELPAQPYYLAAMAELQGSLVMAGGKTLAELAAALPSSQVRRCERALRFVADRQSGLPEVALAIDRVGVSRILRNLPLRIDGREQDLLASFELTADLAPDRAGVHMSRFSEHIESRTLEVLAQQRVEERLDRFLCSIAQESRAAQGARRADVLVNARFSLERWTPVSGRLVQEHYHLHGHARATEHGVRCLIGVEVEGMTACPCAQLMMKEQGIRDLQAAGFSAGDAARALETLPAATHNQRGRGRLLIGLPAGFEQAVKIEDLVELVEQSMSSETYEMLKRPDEFFIVNKAHRNPAFVEDVVRGMLLRAVDLYHDLPEETFFSATQINDESIHKHDAIAAAHGTLGEFRAELAGTSQGQPRTTLDRWLNMPEA